MFRGERDCEGEVGLEAGVDTVAEVELDMSGVAGGGLAMLQRCAKSDVSFLWCIKTSCLHF